VAGGGEMAVMMATVIAVVVRRGRRGRERCVASCWCVFRREFGGL